MSDGAGPSVAVGWHVDLDGLPPGRHTLAFSGSYSGFALDVRYELTVR